MSDELDRAIAAVTDLAGVPEVSRDQFRQLLSAVIGEAETRHETLRIAESPQSGVASFVRPIITAARKLDTALALLQDEISNSGERSAAALKAALLLQVHLMAKLVDEKAEWRAESDRHERGDHVTWLAEYRQHLARLIPAMSSPGRPKKGFFWFVRRLHQIAKETGGRWTHSKVPDKPEWDGTLMRALERLRPFLPSEAFFPEGNLGRSLEDLRKRI